LYKSTTLLTDNKFYNKSNGYGKTENLENSDTTLVFYYLKK